MLNLSLIDASLAASIYEIVLVIFLVSVGIGTIFSSKKILEYFLNVTLLATLIMQYDFA